MSIIRKYFFINHKYIAEPCQDAVDTNYCKLLIDQYGCETDEYVKKNCQKSCKICSEGK